MPRTNTGNVEKLAHKAITEMASAWDAERKIDGDHIAEHVKASENSIQRLEALESMIRDLIMYEKERLKSLQAHHEDITTHEPAIEQSNIKRLNSNK